MKYRPPEARGKSSPSRVKIGTLLLCLTGFSSANVSGADQTINYPAENPLITFSAPDDWKVKVTSGSFFVVSPDGGDVIVEVAAMEAAADDDAAAVKEAESTIDEDFNNLKLTKSDPVEANGLVLSLLGGEGEDSSGRAHINVALIRHPEASHKILFTLIAAKENASTYGAACGAMLDSISAVASGESQSGGHSAVQTFSYPDKAKPDFAVDFPADWNMKATDEGVYVESHDKLVSMNVIMVDKADLLDAEETLKKKVGERFKEILWNGGADPEVNKDAALGLTATFQNAQASDGAGTEKYSVNLVTYERKSGNKVLILLCQNPMRALDKHADAMVAVLKSIKVR